MPPLVFAYLKARESLFKNDKKKSSLVTRSPCFWHKKQKQQVHNCTFSWQLVTRFVIVKVTAPALSPHLTYFKSKGGKLGDCDAAFQLGQVTWKGLIGKRLSGREIPSFHPAWSLSFAQTIPQDVQVTPLDEHWRLLGQETKRYKTNKQKTK